MKVLRHDNESGMALLTVLLVMVLVSGLAAGMFAAVTMEQRSHAIDRDQTQVYSAAHGGLEKLTADLAGLFLTDFSPNKTQLAGLTATGRLPNIPGFDYIAPDGTSGYAISWAGSPTSDPVALSDQMITAGPYAGLRGLLTRYDVTVTARSKSGACASTTVTTCSEVRLRRGLQTVAVPVFQFGVFSDTDLTFFGGDDFDFGGRVHTNGNLWLSEAATGTLLFTDRITAYGDVHRRYLSNGLEAAPNGMSGPVRILAAIGNLSSARTMSYSPNESSVTNSPGGFWTKGDTDAAAVTYCAGLIPTKTAPCWNPNGATTNVGSVSPAVPSWSTVSQTSYAGNIMNRHTGATVLRLPLVSQGAEPIDLIRRPPVNEHTTNPGRLTQRYFNLGYDSTGVQPGQTSLRIMLSDRPEDITNLPTVTATAPILLDGNWRATPPAGYGPVDGTHPAIARSIGVATNTLAAGSTWASGLAQINITGTIDPFFLAPGTSGGPSGAPCSPACSMWITSTLGTAQVTACTARTATTFTGCTVGAPGAALSGTLNAILPSGLTVSAPLTNVVIAATTGRTLTLVSNGTMSSAGSNPTPTARFVPGLMWVIPTTTTTQGRPISCEGYNLVPATKQFTNCRGLSAASEAGTNFTLSSQATTVLNKGLIGGYIKIEKQNALGVWSDVTLEILNLGIGAPNQDGYVCTDPTPNAVLRIQRLRDNGNSTGTVINEQAGCPYGPTGTNGPANAISTSLNAHDWWPNALYDTREGTYRPGVATAGMTLGGIMGYIALDVNNLRLWLAGTIGTTGAQALTNNGYIVYFSDRRGDHNNGDPTTFTETGQYGFENVVNPLTTDGIPAAPFALETGEDFNGNNVFDRWGEDPHLLGIQQADWTGYNAPFNTLARPWTTIAANNAAQARMNRQVLFRRALKLVNGGLRAGNISAMPFNGLTVASENPVYVQGNYNAGNDPVANPSEAHFPAAVIADAVTILSNNWRDDRSFENPNDSTNRPATTTGYRIGVVTGKSLAFPYPGVAGGSPHFLFGTDGGAGNFLRMMEDWRTGGVDLNYRGSMVSLFISHQATGTFKYHSTTRTVYDYADRNFKFDDEFLQTGRLPPGTPMFRDVNLLSFRQILRPNQ